ncbi:2-dehydro-3-deoxygalactonokinase [Halomonas rhizosphaerae]|uniref:2-dehydro-3-deoxygalactonokinase n=1 Tax=Halomonas rhizosphaerae TaxID=3043296 RepID=A0ABT6V3U2_9GAMM|nr:2-dehydro-3-deoxygalactonokinase [Halomonas rhizosphaerae]MDI5892881.1 2-dehydro-3-deoxygalactonokinase [Halomonas rhizosphaerae]
MSQTREVAERLSWVAVDWGSSNLRAWAMTDDGQVVARAGSERGMLALTPDDYEATLLATIGDWLPAEGRVPVRVCGMAGARQGWREAAYLPVPTRLDGLARGAVRPALEDSRLDVMLLPGLCQHPDDAGRHFDVMRGEETQLAGLVAREPRTTGPVCLPGTHAKWARLEAGAITRFATYLTGELYQWLAGQSVLRHSIGQDDLAEPGGHEAFVAAVQEVAAAPETFANRLFGLRAQDLLDSGLPPGQARGARLAARLSGLVIGLELAGARAALAEGETVTLIGTETLAARYALALEALAIGCRCVDGEAATLAGLGLAHVTLARAPRT